MRNRISLVLCLCIASFSVYGCSHSEDSTPGPPPVNTKAPASAATPNKTGAQAIAAPEPAVNPGYNGAVGSKVK